MLKLETILRYEWRLLQRQPWMQGGLIAFLLLTWLAVDTGNRDIHARFSQIDTIRTAGEANLAGVLHSFSDTLTAKGKQAAKVAGNAFMINYRLPQTAVKPPSSIAALSSGLTNIQPWHREVKYTRNFNDREEAPVANPLVLFAGGFDFSFVLIYLLPLLTIAFCYSLYAAEKDAGTSPLLVIHSAGPDFVIRVKMLFRLLLLGGLVSLLILLAFCFAEKRGPCPSGLMLSWIGLSWAYLIFWFAVAYLVLRLRQSSTISLLLLTSCWLLLLVIAPAALSSYLYTKFPLPLKDEIAAYRRHQGEVIWNMPARVLSDTFNRAHPQYASTIDPAKDTLHLSNRYVAGYYYLLERRMTHMLAPYEETVKRRNAALHTLLRWSPAYLLDKAFNETADNDLEAYLRFGEQVDVYQKQWQRFLYRFHFDGRSLTPDDVRRMPRFHYEAGTPSSAGLKMAYILSVSVGLFFAGRIAGARNKTA